MTFIVVEVTSFWRILRYFPNLKSFFQVCLYRNKLSIPCEFIQNDTCLEEYGESDRAHKMKEKSFQVGFTLQKEIDCQRDFFRKRLNVKEMGCWIQIFTTLILWQGEIPRWMILFCSILTPLCNSFFSLPVVCKNWSHIWLHILENHCHRKKHRKNCECCPGHSLTVSQPSKSLSLKSL